MYNLMLYYAKIYLQNNTLLLNRLFLNFPCFFGYTCIIYASGAEYYIIFTNISFYMTINTYIGTYMLLSGADLRYF